MSKIEDIIIGQEHTMVIAITDGLVDRFVQLTGDYNPLHVDKPFAQKTSFGRPVAHGMLGGSFVSTMIGMHLPGPGALWLSQSYEFIAPVFVGDSIRLNAVVTKKSEAQSILFLNIEAFNQKGMIVFKGESKVKMIGEVRKMTHKAIKECKVLVTGGSRGLGAEITRQLAEMGAHVFVNFKSSLDQALELEKKSQGLAGQVQLVQADITTEDGVRSLVNQVKAVDIIVFNAVNPVKQALFLDQELDDFEKALDFGMRSPVRILKSLLPHMVEQKFGRIVSILSTFSMGAPPVGFSSYSMNKKALEALTKSIAVEYGKHNICANMVSPNILRTDLTAHIPERAIQVIEAQTPLKRLASLEEIAANVVYLCSPQAAYINGHNLVLSGGSTIV